MALLRINRPGKANALTAAFWPQLRGLLDAAAGGPPSAPWCSPGAGTARSPRAATSGRSPSSTAPRRAVISSPTACAPSPAIEECRLPVIAAVNGLALGGGCELALACDMVLAAEHAAFGLPEASVGLVPGFGILRAPSVLGRHTAKLMVLAGERISAQRAYELGLAQQVLPAASSCRPRCGSAPGSPSGAARGRGRQAHGQPRRGPRRAGYGVEAVTMLYATSDAAEGIRAFTERREPRFEGAEPSSPSSRSPLSR